MDWYTVIPTKNRPTELGNLMDSLMANQVASPGKILIINNGTSGGVPQWIRDRAMVIRDSDASPHIYQMWNTGLAWAERQATRYGETDLLDLVTGTDRKIIRPHAVAILNDDVVLPPDFAARVIQCLRDTNSTIVFPDQGPGIINQFPIAGYPQSSDRMPQKRITGYAFVVNGTHGIRCDENFKWWYGDDDLDWQARRDYHGTWEVDVTVKHAHPGASTHASPALTAQAGRDRETFVKKWGKAPW